MINVSLDIIVWSLVPTIVNGLSSTTIYWQFGDDQRLVDDNWYLPYIDTRWIFSVSHYHRMLDLHDLWFDFIWFAQFWFLSFVVVTCTGMRFRHCPPKIVKWHWSNSVPSQICWQNYEPIYVYHSQGKCNLIHINQCVRCTAWGWCNWSTLS